jgi:hypothetical protein
MAVEDAGKKGEYRQTLNVEKEAKESRVGSRDGLRRQDAAETEKIRRAGGEVKGDEKRVHMVEGGQGVEAYKSGRCWWPISSQRAGEMEAFKGPVRGRSVGFPRMGRILVPKPCRRGSWDH